MTTYQHTLPGVDRRPQFMSDTHDMPARRTSYTYELRLTTDQDTEEDIRLLPEMETFLIESGGRSVAGSYDTTRCEFTYHLWFPAAPVGFLLRLATKWQAHDHPWAIALRATLELLEISDDTTRVVANHTICDSLNLAQLSYTA